MEPMEAVSEGEWSSLSGIYTAEEAQFMAQLLESAPLNTEPGFSLGFSGSLPAKELNVVHSSFYHHSIGFSSTGVIFPLSYGHENENLYLRESSDGSISIDSGLVGEQDFLNLDMAGKNVLNLEDEEEEAEDKKKKSSCLESSRKRSRSTGNAQKMKRNVKSKKSHQNLEFLSQNEENDNARVYKQSSSSCCSEDDSSISQGQNAGPGSSKEDPMALNLSRKTRASRGSGSAADPQSLYARRRRERINERLKILQGLLPNGTKVNISTMLEEAVHYVKFLQLQIKLLSSDDMWMYAPIAYKGINIGLDLKI